MAVKRFKGAKAKADKLFSEIIRSIGECENCYSTEWLQCAHIISRRYSNTRTDLRNAFCLCAKCHRKYTDHPREFSKFITDTWAQEYYEDIYRKSQEVGKINWDDEAERLKGIKKLLDQEQTTLDILRGEEF
jgi:hypothetical protein